MPTRPIRSRPASRRARVAFTALLLGSAVLGTASADTLLDLIGGPGGGAFEARCGDREALSGFDLHAADDVDAIRPLCLRIDATTQAPVARGDWHGGDGGAPNSVACPNDKPFVTGMFVRWEGQDTWIVNNIHLYCTKSVDAPSADQSTSASFDAPDYVGDSTLGFVQFSSEGNSTQRCPAGQVATGMRGRSGIWVDAIGLICAALSTTAVTSIGKVDTGLPPGPKMSLCERAADARRRNSPAAADLEAQCQASKTPVPSIGRVPVASPPGPPMTICQRAADARRRKSPAAPNLEAQCAAQGGKR